MRYRGAAYRGIHPKWSHKPASGDGAAIRGARFNPKGVPALYLATTPEGAFLQATQGFAYKFKPLTLCAFEIDCADIVDLTDEDNRDRAAITLFDMGAPWALDLSEGRRPASWSAYERLHGTASGILVPSFAANATAGMRNLVLWHWGDELPHKVEVHDPDHRLPRSQSSWRDNP